MSAYMHAYTHIGSIRKSNLPSISKGQCLGPRHSRGVQRHGPYQRARWERAMGLVSPIGVLAPCPSLSQEGGSWTGFSSIASAQFGKAERPVISHLNTRLRWEHLHSIRRVSLPNIAFISGIRPPQLLQSQDVSLTHQQCCDWFELKIGPGN